MIEFEIKTEKQKEMLQAVRDFLSDIMNTYGKESLIKSIVDKNFPPNMLSDVLNRAMTGGLSKYLGMFLSKAKSGLPIKTDAMRLFISMQAHGGSAFDSDMGIISMWPLILLSRIIPLNNDVILERFSETALGLPSFELN